MYNKVNSINLILIFVMSISLIFLAGAAQPQENPESSGNQPSYIDELVESSPLTQSHVDNMKNGGDSWGNIRITARMAEQIAAKNSDPEKTAEQKYQEALNYVLQQRAAGKGYGNIANDNNISLGSVMRNDNAAQNQQKDKTQIQNKEQEQNKNREQTQVQQQTQTQTKKKGIFGRFFGIFSKDKKEQKQETSSKTQTKESSTKAKTQQDVSNKVQTQNSSSSQNVKNQQRTETNQRTQMQTENGNSRGGGRGK
jgi:hypothetical protein